jgi:hypothetical protein
MDYDQGFRDYMQEIRETITQVDGNTRDLLNRNEVLLTWARENNQPDIEAEAAKIRSEIDSLILSKARISSLMGEAEK